MVKSKIASITQVTIWLNVNSICFIITFSDSVPDYNLNKCVCDTNQLKWGDEPSLHCSDYKLPKSECKAGQYLELDPISKFCGKYINL